MKNRTELSKFSTLLGGCLTALLLSSGAYAQGHGGGGGGHAAASGGHAGGYAGGYRGGYAGGYRGGYAGGYRGGYGGYGWRGGYGYGWRGYGGWGCCGWGWGWAGLGLGLYFATLPLYYQTYWWNGVPYYYADNTYYSWDPNVQQYVTVAPPAGLQGQAAPTGSAPQAGGDLMVYPKNGQSPEQQSKDRFECHQWAAAQSGFDPTLGTAPAGANNKRYDYMRAQAACLEGRGYSVQ